MDEYIIGSKLLVRYYAATTLRYAVLIAFSLFFTCSAADKDVPIKTIERIKRSVVPIVCGYIDEQHRFQVVAIAGSGFFVDLLGRFITAGHVLDNWQNISRTRHACGPSIYIPDHGWKNYEQAITFQSFTFINCARDATVDLAVCQPIENPFTSRRISRDLIASVAFDAQAWPEGMPVAFTGFPLEFVFPITSKGNVAGHARIEGRQANFDYIIDKAAWPGASGSPIYLSNGKVVGIILRAGRNEGSGLAFGRSAAVIVDFLTQHPATHPEQQHPTPQH